MAYQDIKRAIVLPSYPVPPTDEETWERYLLSIQKVAAENYSRLAREVTDCHNQIQVYQLPVAGAAGNLAVVWIPPFYDAFYSAFATPDWDTTVFYSLQLNTGIQLNFGTAAPGGGGNVLVMGIR